MARQPRVTIHYVDGSVHEFDAGVWPATRSDGVDRVVVCNESGPSVFGGSSAYWLYREGDLWVAGQACFGYSAVVAPEVLFLLDGTQDTRPIDYVPDLPHAALKLGWWRPGEERPPWP